MAQAVVPHEKGRVRTHSQIASTLGLVGLSNRRLYLEQRGSRSGPCIGVGVEFGITMIVWDRYSHDIPIKMMNKQEVYCRRMALERWGEMEEIQVRDLHIH